MYVDVGLFTGVLFYWFHDITEKEQTTNKSEWNTKKCVLGNSRTSSTLGGNSFMWKDGKNLRYNI